MGFLGLPNVWRDEDSDYWKDTFEEGETMRQDLDKTNFKKEVWERNGYWYARIASDYEDEGTLESGGHWYKRAQTQKLRVFKTEEEANTWADRSTSAQKLAITTGR